MGTSQLLFWMALKMDRTNPWRRKPSVATVSDAYMLTPVSEAVRLYTTVAGEHGWEGAVALLSCL